MRLLALLPLLLTGCDRAEREALREARGEAEARLVAAPSDWTPDASLTFPIVELERVADALMDDVLTRAPAVGAALPGGGPAFSVQPKLQLDALRLEMHPTLPDAMLARGALSGTLGAQVGGRSLGVATNIELVATLRLDVVEGLAVMIRLAEVDEVRVVTGGRRGREARMGAMVEELLRQRLLERPPQAPLARMGETGMPIVAARLRAEGPLVRVELRTDVPESAAALPTPAPDRGAALAMTDASFTALARRQVWARQGDTPRPFLEPRRVDLGDGRFTAEVRLWNPGYPVWWQDFEVAGPIMPDGDRMRVSFDRVEPRGGSGWFGSGNMVATPLLDALGAVLGGRLESSVPGDLARQVRGVRIGARLRGLSDAPGGFVLEADVQAEATRP